VGRLEFHDTTGEIVGTEVNVTRTARRKDRLNEKNKRQEKGRVDWCEPLTEREEIGYLFSHEDEEMKL